MIRHYGLFYLRGKFPHFYLSDKIDNYKPSRSKVRQLWINRICFRNVFHRIIHIIHFFYSKALTGKVNFWNGT